MIQTGLDLFLTIAATIILSVLAAIGLVWLIRRRTTMRGTEDLEGIYVVALDTLYAIFIAFMIFVVWTRYDAATITVDEEANTLTNIYRLAAALPEPVQGRVQAMCVQYANTMIDQEWKTMSRGEKAPPGRPVIQNLWREVTVGTRGTGDEVLREHLMDELVELTHARRMRLLEARAGLPGILYGVLLFGGILAVAFAAVFQAESFAAHSLKVGMLAAIISLMVFTVFAIDHPFDGYIHVSPEAFRQALEVMRAWK